MTTKTRTNKPAGNFFYLEDSTIQNFTRTVNARAIFNDVQRGVRRLNEEAYCQSYGVTRSSLAFAIIVNQMVGITAKRAELTYTPQKHYTLKVFTRSGFEVVFKGVSGGYFGEGARGCYDILKFCGFSEEQCQRVWENENFTVSKRKF